MSSDPNKKSARSFQCRDVLWETFEQMARELECSVDYLVNEAMKQYVRQLRAPGASTSPGGLPSAPPAAHTAGAMRAAQPSLLPSRLPPPPIRPLAGGAALPPIPSGPASRAGVGSLRAPAPAPSRSNAPPPLMAPPGGASARSIPPPLPRANSSLAPPAAAAVTARANGQSRAPQASVRPGTLSVFYQGEKFPVAKDRFVIGRGKQSTDLTLKDPNVSRQHAMIESQHGAYFMVDMGSTNGVEHNGESITRRQIAEGDVFRICDHELRFTYR